MGCCTARCLTWTVGILHLLLTPLAAVYYLYILCISEEEKREIFKNYENQKDEIFHMGWVGTLYCLLAFAASITLIVGLKMNRYKLLEPFKTVMYMGGAYWVVRIIMHTYRGIRDKQPALNIVVIAIFYLILTVLQIICYLPVSKLRKQMRSAERNIPEQHGLRHNQHLNKPY